MIPVHSTTYKLCRDRNHNLSGWRKHAKYHAAQF